jgi:hypothetical protein
MELVAQYEKEYLVSKQWLLWDLRDVANLDDKREQTAKGQSTTVFLLRIQIRRYGRKLADILNVSPTYLSLLVNGKHPWRGNLKERHQQLVTTSVNTPEGACQLLGSSLMNSKDLPLSRPLPDRSGAEEGTRTLTPLSWQRILSRSEAHPPSGSVRGSRSSNRWTSRAPRRYWTGGIRSH